jgi:hypothetical protein
MSYFIMHRKGKCHPRMPTPNQCKVAGHPNYTYDISMIFPSNITLDDNQFIINHQDIDDIIQATYLKGSCEQMHLKLQRKLTRFFSSRGIEILGFKIKLQGDSNDMAYMEFLSLEPVNNHLIPLL